MGLRYLLDTSVYSQPLRRNPLPASQAHWQRHGDDSLAVPTMAMAELEYGLFLKDSKQLWAAYRAILKDRLRALPFSTAAASTFGELKARQQQRGKTVDDFDLAIAAIALTHHLKVATLNHQHFRLIEGLHWEDWSQP